MLRIAATWLVLAATAVAASGCGKSNISLASSAQVLAFARAVNLRNTDAPEMSVAGSNVLLPSKGSGGSVPCEAGETASLISSRVLVARTWETFSYVVPMHSEASAARYVSDLDTSRRGSCFVPGVESSPSPSITRLSAALPSGQRYVGVRVVSPPLNRRSERLHIDTFLFAVGPTLVGLIALSGDPAPPRLVEQRLLSLLYSRAKAHKL
ncbi:MAG: hypothetical protein H0X28_11220 [Solirubrobacterales bacterium]|nr:hypothetical protein [Solirubrobacterales bacterium]